MKTKLLIIIAFAGLLVLTSPAFASEKLFEGTSSIERIPLSISPKDSEIIEIKFQYTDGPYSLTLKPFVDVNPQEAVPFVNVKFELAEGVTRYSIKRFLGTITVDPDIPSEKIFLNISYNGTYSIVPPVSYKSGWDDSAIIDVVKNNSVSDDSLVPEPDQDNPVFTNCVEGTILKDGICVVEKETDTAYSVENWGLPVKTLKHLSPLKQIKSGVALIDVQCSEEKYAVYKHDRMSVACVSEETQNELWSRGWATMRFYTEEETSSHALCNNYEGKWHPEYEGCRDVTDLQCSLMGGKFVDGLKICYDEICSGDKTYTLCVTNLDLISGENEN